MSCLDWRNNDSWLGVGIAVSEIACLTGGMHPDISLSLGGGSMTCAETLRAEAGKQPVHLSMLSVSPGPECDC